MLKKFLTYFICFIALYQIANGQDAAQLHETAKLFMKQGDYANATLVLNRLVQTSPDNAAYAKDLALVYYFQKDYTRAQETIKPILEKEEADDQCFTIAGTIYKEQGLYKECEKIYKKGLKKYPESGVLLNGMGEVYYVQKNYEAIKYWEKGIEVDPSFSKNYYNAARYYYMTTDKVWSIIYGEIFINMEPNGGRTPEMKTLLLNSYKKLFTESDLEAKGTVYQGFEKAYIQTMNKQSMVAIQGISTESLTMIRTRFMIEWMPRYQSKYPFQLFNFHLQLLREGMFDAYNQWLFGMVENLAGYQNWTRTNDADYKAFSDFQRSRIFKMPVGQYYHKD